MKTQEKQEKILKILKTFSTKRLDKITEDEFTFKKMSRKEMYWVMECVWIDLGKTQATNKEMIRGIKNVYTLFILEDLKRHGLLKLDKKGFFDKTELGKEVNKLMTEKRGKTA